jgi:hypothetical protein
MLAAMLLVALLLLLLAALRFGSGGCGCCCSGSWLRRCVPALVAFGDVLLVEFVASMSVLIVGENNPRSENNR